MKAYSKAILAALSLFCASSLWAQKLETRDFKETSDLRAQLKDTQVIDENSGKKAALIRIFTPFSNESLGFDAGLYQILGRRQAAPGEVWVYVPERTQKLTITHPKYGPTVLWFDGVEAEAGKTYTVSLNVEGRDVSLVASAQGAEISVDGEPQGKSPVQIHMPLGSHLVRAELGNLLFEDVVTLTPQSPLRFDLPMVDENLRYGDVDIEVADGAELWFQDAREGVGSLSKHLREGSYVVTSRLPDHEDRTTAFTVEAGKRKRVEAAAPVAHLGYVSIVTEPEHGVTATLADSVVTLMPTMQLPVARYDYTFTKRGYHPARLSFRLERGETFRDTVRLEKIQYVPKTTGYAAVSFSAASTSGVSFAIGGFIQNVNVEASYTLGLGRSNEVDWYGRDDKVYYGSYTYRCDIFGGKVGYQLRFAERFGLTPQVGFELQRLTAREKTEPGNGFTQASATVGVRFAFHPAPHIGIFAAPQYGIPVGDKGDGKEVFSQGGITRGGFRACIGIAVNL